MASFEHIGFTKGTPIGSSGKSCRITIPALSEGGLYEISKHTSPDKDVRLIVTPMHFTKANSEAMFGVAKKRADFVAAKKAAEKCESEIEDGIGVKSK
jgi:hypothetical protein